jgi:anionic cell wall polymer biosynthesis LytR-Cps2A-Psr (LCP) family protein
VNDRQDPYGQVYGYDEYGRPLYRTPEGYGAQEGAQGGAQEYGTGEQPPVYDGYEGYGAQEGAQDYGTGEQPPAYGTYQGGYQDPYQGSYDYGAQAVGSAHAAPPGQAPPEYDYGYQAGQPGADPGYSGPGEGYDAYQGGYGGQAGQAGQADAGSFQGYEGYGAQEGAQDYGTGEQPPVAPGPATAPPAPPGAGGQERSPEPDLPGQRPSPEPPPASSEAHQDGEEGYRTEQFAFVDDRNDDSEDVIDWLKFTESRTERREEAKRRGKIRRRLLAVLLVLAVLGGVAFLWATDRLPGVSGPQDSSGGELAAETRDVIVVHLRETGGDLSSTALLVANETTGEATTLLLPNDLAITPTSGTTTLGQAVSDSSAGDVRDALSSLLGTDITGTWRLDTPYLVVLVNALGGITVDTNAEVTSGEGDDAEEIPAGEDVTLDGDAAVAYATHLGEDEQQTAQLERFGQVMAAVLEKMPAERAAATEVVRALAQVHDPSLTEEELGASLARLAGYSQEDSHSTVTLPVEEDGTLSEETSDGLVQDILGGTVSNADPSGASRIGIRDASGGDGTTEEARIALVNGGFNVVDARATDGSRAESSVVYTSEEHRETALEAARTLGLPEESVTQGDGAGNADVTITLGEDYLE